eukprot:Skav214903  [mRNA]  locus=scaffold1561:151982:153133:- [translate_table: standard]
MGAMLLSWGVLLSTALAGPAPPVVLVFESFEYISNLATHVGDKVALRRCSSIECDIPSSERTPQEHAQVVAVVGMPRNISVLQELPRLKLFQSSHYMYARLDTVPAPVTVANYAVDWRAYGVEPIAEFVIAAAFQWILDV